MVKNEMQSQDTHPPPAEPRCLHVQYECSSFRNRVVIMFLRRFLHDSFLLYPDAFPLEFPYLSIRTGHESNTAQRKTDKCPSPTSQPPFIVQLFPNCLLWLFLCDFLLFIITNITQLQNLSVHLFQQWITDICKCTCIGYAYIIYKKVQTYRQPYKQRVEQSTS